MTTVAIRRNVVVGMTPKQRRLLKFVADKIDFGDPADYTAPGAVRWWVWDDHRIGLTAMAALGTFTRLLAQADGSIIEPADGQSPREAVQEWVKANWDLTQPPVDEPNPYQWVLTKNGAPAAVQASNGLPVSWVPTPGV